MTPTHYPQPKRTGRTVLIVLVTEPADDLGAVAILVLDHGQHAELQRSAPQPGCQLPKVNTNPRKRKK